MTKRSIALIPVVIMLVVSCVDASAAANYQNKRASGGTAFAEFSSRFKTAVVKNDGEAVADMTKLPFMLENAELGRAEYIKKIFAAL